MTAREKNIFTILQNELNPSDSSDDEDITAASSEDEYVPSDDTDSEDDFIEEDFEPIVREEEEVEPEDEALGGEQCASSSQDFYTAKDGTIWQSTPSQRRRTQQHNTVRCRAGPKNMPGTLTEVIQAFRLYSSDKVLDLIVKHTNAEATRIYKEKRQQSTWNPTDRTEILAYIGLVMAAGHLKQRHLCLEKCGIKSMDHLFSGLLCLNIGSTHCLDLYGLMINQRVQLEEQKINLLLYERSLMRSINFF